MTDRHAKINRDICISGADLAARYGVHIKNFSTHRKRAAARHGVPYPEPFAFSRVWWIRAEVDQWELKVMPPCWLERVGRLIEQ